MPPKVDPKPDPAVVGKRGPTFKLSNVAVHASLLPTGRVLYWGRRSDPTATTPASLNEPMTKAFFLDFAKTPPIGVFSADETAKSIATATPPMKTEASTQKETNLFCSGHCFLPDGTLFVVGGHIQDGLGETQACIYDSSDGAAKKPWAAKPLMNAGRWYPSALTLPDGSVLAISGSLSTGFVVNNVPQLWRNEKWNTLPTPKLVTPLYPKLHLDPSGRVFVAGPQKQSQFLTVHPTDASLSTWKLDGPVRGAGQREYGSSVMYDSGKILFCGGGNDRDPQGKEMWGPTTNMTEIIDLNPRVQDGTTVTPTWELSEEMLFPRRHHNATVLPDGTVLVTGGTKGVGFNNLLDNNPVHEVSRLTGQRPFRSSFRA